VDEAKSQFELGVRLLGEKALDASLAAFRRSSALYPTRGADQNVAVLLGRLKRYAEAYEAWEKLLVTYRDMREEDRNFAEGELRKVAPFVGELAVDVDVSGATIVLDGVERGRTPVGPMRVTAGSRTLRVFKEGYAPLERTVDVASQTTTTTKAKLFPLDAGGKLQVTEGSGGVVDVVLDGVRVGKTPWEGRVTTGQHAVWLRGAASLGSVPASVVVRDRDTARLNLAMETLLCRLRVEPIPVTGRVFVDGVNLGRGVYESASRCGPHVVEVMGEGYLPQTQRLSLVVETPTSLRIELERDPNSKEFAAQYPPRILLGVGAYGLIVPAPGGDLAGGCGGACSSRIPLGAGITASLGYRTGLGLSFGATFGYLLTHASYTNRETSLQPLGFAAHRGTSDDSVFLHGPTLAAFAAFERGDRVSVGGRLAGGIWIGVYHDERTGAFRTPLGTPYPATEVSESGIAPAPFVHPEVRVGFRATSRLRLVGSLGALTVFGLRANARWRDEQAIPAGVPSSPEYRTNGGQGTYGGAALVGGLFVILTPGVSAQLEL
jgi:hypothetical protein